jgi:pimeloyl-ACP methyl ester carboxylesterase
VWQHMYVEVNSARLFFDVEGAGLVPDGPTMRAKPTLLLLHGGPGFDHTSYKPAFSALADIVQVIYLDHRGNGRSSGDDPATWNLAQWGDDVKAFCDVLGIDNPIVYGASFGGMVALSYATRHPAHPGKLILVSTEAAGHSHLNRRIELFERLGGQEVGELARRRFLEGKFGVEDMEAWVSVGFRCEAVVDRSEFVANDPTGSSARWLDGLSFYFGNRMRLTSSPNLASGRSPFQRGSRRSQTSQCDLS